MKFRRRELEMEQAKLLAKLALETGRPLIPPPSRHPSHWPKPPNFTTLRLLRKGRHRLCRLAQRDGWSCYLCGEDLDGFTAQVEHVIPIAHGGDNEDENLALACARCNRIKGAKIVAFDVNSRRPWYASGDVLA